MTETKRYFAGANSTQGFAGYFEHIIPPNEAEHIYCIKGGPGVGKSTFMKKMCKLFEEKGHKVSCFHCPSDPSSLDGVLSENLKIAFVDGTSPHITDPVYPGAGGSILDFGMFFDEELLKGGKKEIIDLTNEVSDMFLRAGRKLKTVGNIYDNVKRIYRNNESERKINILCKKLSERIFGESCGDTPSVRKLFLTAITPDGLKSFAEETLKGYELFVLDSFCGDASFEIMTVIKNEAVLKGLRAECFYCPLSPRDKIDHIIFPELNKAITVSNSYHINNLPGEEYDLSRCYVGRIDKPSVSKAMETADELISDCVSKLNKARALHSELEAYYINAMDYEKLDRYTEKIVEKLKMD